MQAAQKLLADLPDLLQAEGQRLLVQVTKAPIGLAWTALALAVLFTVLHRHALRPLSALLLGAACAGLSLGVLAPALPAGSGLPGILAILGAGVSLGLGLASPGWASALISMLCWGALGGFAAVKIGHFDWRFGAPPFGLLGLMMGLANQRALSVWMPPIWSALLCTLSITRLTNGEGALEQLPAFAHAPVAGGLFLLLAAVLLAVSVEREHRRRLLAQEKEDKKKAGPVRTQQKR